jgi:hypothetical protein
MKKFYTFVFLLACYSTSFAQSWSDDVAQIVYNKCTKCHHNGGIAPFPLMTYNESSPMAAAIYDAVSQDRMPPWPPDNNYQQYVHNRALSSSEKTTIQNWVLAGAPEGNAANTPPPPVYSSGTLLGNGDLTVQIPTYMSKATSMNDDYACFAVPSGLLQNRTIKSIEIIPGNRQIVHHALIYLDPGAVESTDSIGGNCASPSNQNTKLIAGYTPGSTPMILPSVAPLKLGIDISAGSQVYFAMHYPAGSYGQFDSTKVIFHFYPTGTTGVRQVSADAIIQNWSFSLPPNQLTNVTAQYPAGSGGIPAKISVLSVFPHMHLLGKSIKAYAIKPGGDTLKLANIPHWDFHWQDFYFFKYIQVAPMGSKIKGEGIYDNTATNVHNPNNPPVTVTAGLNTSDEMFLVYFHYMLYQNGDENYNMEDLMSASLDEQLIEEDKGILVFPNPMESNCTIRLSRSKPGDQVSISIYDYTGKLISVVEKNALVTTESFESQWNGKNEAGEEVKPGIYFISVNTNGFLSTSQLVKR